MLTLLHVCCMSNKRSPQINEEVACQLHNVACRRDCMLTLSFLNIRGRIMPLHTLVYTGSFKVKNTSTVITVLLKHRLANFLVLA